MLAPAPTACAVAPGTTMLTPAPAGAPARDFQTAYLAACTFRC
ncbi:MAG TPA: hypothetical protein VLW17_08675 [Thermoanaerobaculaceae bacterium]|nr:hypothetical protein [Thermoanaerobaculaceae bacterium]